MAEKLGDLPLRLAIIGHNPSRKAWATGHYYGNPANHMWRILRDTGIAPAEIRCVAGWVGGGGRTEAGRAGRGSLGRRMREGGGGALESTPVRDGVKEMGAPSGQWGVSAPRSQAGMWPASVGSKCAAASGADTCCPPSMPCSVLRLL